MCFAFSSVVPLVCFSLVGVVFTEVLEKIRHQVTWKMRKQLRIARISQIAFSCVAKVRSSEVSKLSLTEHPPLDAAAVFYLEK
jgi:hypothetical protein